MRPLFLDEPFLRYFDRFPSTFQSRLLENSPLPPPTQSTRTELLWSSPYDGPTRSSWILKARKPVSSPTVCRSHEVRYPSTDFHDSNLIGAPTWMRSENGAHLPSFHSRSTKVSSPSSAYQSRASPRPFAVFLALSSSSNRPTDYAKRFRASVEGRGSRRKAYLFILF